MNNSDRTDALRYCSRIAAAQRRLLGALRIRDSERIKELLDEIDGCTAAIREVTEADKQ